MSFDRATIGAFVDGELNEIERRRFEAAIARDPALAAEVAAERDLRERLRRRFDSIAAAPVPERLAQAASAGAAVTPLRAEPKRGVAQWFAIAASLAVGVLVGAQLQPAADPLTASAPLARALETQLASAPSAGAAVRIGLTFKAVDGAWCRSFADPSAAGVACRNGGAWRLRRLEADPGQSAAYRQAGAGALAAAVEEMAAAPPLDAAEEQRLVARGWR